MSLSEKSSANAQQHRFLQHNKPRRRRCIRRLQGILRGYHLSVAKQPLLKKKKNGTNERCYFAFSAFCGAISVLAETGAEQEQITELLAIVRPLVNSKEAKSISGI